MEASEPLTLAQMFFDVNKNLCEMYGGLNPLSLLDYPAEDVFNLIVGTVDYNERSGKKPETKRSNVVRKRASDNWF